METESVQFEEIFVQPVVVAVVAAVAAAAAVD